jgi:hypothetical protein
MERLSSRLVSRVPAPLSEDTWLPWLEFVVREEATVEGTMLKMYQASFSGRSITSSEVPETPTKQDEHDRLA